MRIADSNPCSVVNNKKTDGFQRNISVGQTSVNEQSDLFRQFYLCCVFMRFFLKGIFVNEQCLTRTSDLHDAFPLVDEFRSLEEM